MYVVGVDQWGRQHVVGVTSPYADALAKVGLHPDNPDGMYAQLQAFISNPLKFKNADSCWPGKRDSVIAYEQNGVLLFEWPFGGGKWWENYPKNDAQVRAVFKIPGNQQTLPFLKKLYRSSSKLAKYKISAPAHQCPSGGGGFDLGNAVNSAVHAVQSGLGTVAHVASVLRIPGANLAGALLTGHNPIDGLKADVQNFADAANLAKNVASGNLGAVASDLTKQAATLGVDIPPAAVQAAVTAAASGKSPTEIATTALGDAYKDAWNVAHNYGKIASDLPPPPGLDYHPNAVPEAVATHPLSAFSLKPPGVAHAAVPAVPSASSPARQLPGPSAPIANVPPVTARTPAPNAKRPGSPGAPAGATHWTCTPGAGGIWQCKWV